GRIAHRHSGWAGVNSSPVGKGWAIGIGPVSPFSLQRGQTRLSGGMPVTDQDLPSNPAAWYSFTAAWVVERASSVTAIIRARDGLRRVDSISLASWSGESPLVIPSARMLASCCIRLWWTDLIVAIP